MAVASSAGRFAGEVGVVTGAASGLGRATALGLAREGARLVLLDREEAGLLATAAACGGAVIVTGDVAKAADLERLAADRHPARRLALATEIQREAHENVTFPIAGQFQAPGAWRGELRGVIDFGFPVMWNIERTAR